MRLQDLSIMGKTAVNIHVQAFGWRDVFTPLDKYLGAQLLDHSTDVLSFVRSQQAVSEMAAPFCARTPGWCVRVLYLAALVGSRVNLRFPGRLVRGHFPHAPICLPYVAFGEVSVKVSAQFVVELFAL